HRQEAAGITQRQEGADITRRQEAVGEDTALPRTLRDPGSRAVGSATHHLSAIPNSLFAIPCFEAGFPERRIEFEGAAEVAPGLVRVVAGAFSESGDIKVIGACVFPSVFLRRAARQVVQNPLAFA